MVTDYDEELGYDADHNDESQYCAHGTFIGSWWGPDYLCSWCELGEEPDMDDAEPDMGGTEEHE